MLGLIGLGFMFFVCHVRDSAAEPSSAAQKQELKAQVPLGLRGVGVEQRLGKSIDLSLKFVDHLGQKKSLKQLFQRYKTVILTLNYYRCPQLCTYQLNGLIEALRKMNPGLRKSVGMVTVSIDPREKPALAKSKRANYLSLFEKDRPPEWTFMVGSQHNIRALARSVGFSYRYVLRRKEFAHKAVLFVLTPQGKISKYIGGIRFRPRDLEFALTEASAGKVGSLWTQILMSCFVYDASVGKYTPYAFGIVRLGGVLTVFVLSIFLSLMWIHERRVKAEKIKA
ncbi:MAG: SCO family protein [Myxococcota bacterium]